MSKTTYGFIELSQQYMRECPDVVKKWASQDDNPLLKRVALEVIAVGTK